MQFDFWLGVDAAGVAGIWQGGREDVWGGLARRGGVRAVHLGLPDHIRPVAFYMWAPYMGVISEASYIPDVIIPDMATAPTWSLVLPLLYLLYGLSCPAISPLLSAPSPLSALRVHSTSAAYQVPNPGLLIVHSIQRGGDSTQHYSNAPALRFTRISKPDAKGHTNPILILERSEMRL